MLLQPLGTSHHSIGLWVLPVYTCFLELILSGPWSRGKKEAMTMAQEHSPAPALFVRFSVLLHEGCEPQQGALVQEVDLAGKLPVDLQ